MNLYRALILRLYNSAPEKASRSRKAAAGKLLFLDGDLSGRRSYFALASAKPVFLRRNAVVRVYGELKDAGSRRVPPLFFVREISPDFDSAVELAYRQRDVDGSKDTWDSWFLSVSTAREIRVARAAEEGFPAFADVPYATALAALASSDESAVLSLFDQANLGLDLGQALKVYDFFVHRARRVKKTVYDLVKTCPWIISQVDGINSKLGSALASHLGLPPGDEAILAAAVSVCVAKSRKGDAYVPEKVVLAAVRDLWRRVYGTPPDDGDGRREDLNRGWLRKWLVSTQKGSPVGRLVPDLHYFDEVAAEREALYRFSGSESPEKEAREDARSVYLAGAFHQERESAELLADLARTSPPDLRQRLLPLLESSGLDRYQKEAVESALRDPVVVWSGPAGSGKTKALKELLRACAGAGVFSCVLAPTAIAASRAASGLSGVEYATIHRRARILPGMDDYADPDTAEMVESEAGQPAPFVSGVVAVDEMSMCDLGAFRRLLSIVCPGVHLVLVGDPAQLPPIGPAGFFHQLVRIPVPGIKIINLQGSHRSGDPVCRAANAVRLGVFDVPPASSPEDAVSSALSGGVCFLDPGREPLVSAAERLAVLFSKNVSSEDLLFLCPKRGGEAGTYALNLMLSGVFNPSGRPVPDSSLKLGDPVVTVENDYAGADPRRHPKRPDVYNGSRGRVVSFHRGGEPSAVVQFDGFDAPYYTRELFRWLEAAYALTVHKAQGGEVRFVVVIASAPMDRRMLYTALTRAKEGAILLGPKKAFESAALALPPEPRSKFVHRYNDGFLGLSAAKRVPPPPPSGPELVVNL